MKFPWPGRWMRFSLRTLLLTITFCCVVMGIWTVYVQPYRDQAKAAVLISKCGGHTESEAAPGTAWQQWLVVTCLGEGKYVAVTSADLRNTQASRETLMSLANLRFLRELYLDHTQTDDDTLTRISQLQELRTLSLRYTPISDRGGNSITRLTKLEELFLSGTNVTDETVDSLAKLESLRQLYVRWSDLTPSGVERLQILLPNSKIHYHQLSDHSQREKDADQVREHEEPTEDDRAT